ncbi:MAG: glycosyltransferase family 4 protein [Anaerolineae bacterium]|nr:glycosyltransferase family 4 protein [Anaerolineae bacterium]
MRISIITGEYPPMQGGVGDFSRELAVALADQGHAISVLTSRPDPSTTVSAHSDQRIQLNASIRSWNAATFGTIQQWVAEQRPDVINIQYEAAAFKMSQMIHLLPRLLRRYPVVTTYHDLLVPYLFPKAGSLRQQALLYVAQTSNAVIVTNRQDAQQLRSAPDIPSLHTIPIGSNISDQPPLDYDRATWRAQLGIPPDAILAGYFGFLNVSKGIDILLNGVAGAVQQGLDLHLLMIGGNVGSSDASNATQVREVQALIRTLNLDSRVHWTGFVDNPLVSANLHACDMLLLPYRDGVSYRRGSFMAGLTHGCAIITTQPQIALPELRDGEQVRLIQPDAAQLTAAIRDLAADPALRTKLGVQARELSLSFSWDRIAAQTIGVFEEAIRRH